MDMRRIIFSFITVVILSGACHSQEVMTDNLPGLKKNAINLTLGFGGLYLTGLCNYERMVYEIPRSFVSSLWLRAGLGPWLAWEEDGMNYFSSLMIMTGRNKSHFEFSAGIMVMHTSYDNYNTVLPAGNIGYRLQKPGSGFAFRAGAGWPEAGYVSIGLCF